MIVVLGLIVLLVGVVAALGLSMFLAGARHTSRRGLEQWRRETVAVRKDRDDMVDQREAARAETASMPRDSSPPGEAHVNPVHGRRRAPLRAPNRLPPRHYLTG